MEQKDTRGRREAAGRKGKDSERFAPFVVKYAAEHQLDIDYSKFRVAPDSKYSCLMPFHVAYVRDFFAKAVTGNIASAIDATANIGADTVNLARMYPGAKISALENNLHTFELLKSNVETFKLPKVTALHMDAVKYVNALSSDEKVDLVYCDPPWGGPGYLNEKEVSLSLSGVDVGEFVGSCLKHAKTVVVKVPVNFAIDKFKERLKKHRIVRAGIPRRDDGEKREFAFYLIAVYQ
ncbi:MAG: RsmD family RNA methyltransferase [Patescibacteria group bacterium]|nr:RsmD family RNA methyltransferase [Patescibacteria group bacterium]